MNEIEFGRCGGGQEYNEIVPQLFTDFRAAYDSLTVQNSHWFGLSVKLVLLKLFK
jgi:hypothetical protein